MAQPQCYTQLLDYHGIHRAHTGCPDSLSCLVDSSTEPADVSTPTLIRCAIGSGSGRLMNLHDIIVAVQNKYSFYRGKDQEGLLRVCTSEHNAARVYCDTDSECRVLRSG